MKEKIIDGVDVAGCRSYKHNAENIGWSICLSKDEEHYHSNNPLCCEKKDCLYKQLKRLEQENEKLKEQFEIETLKNNDTNECIYRSNLLNKYKHALEEIREIATDLKQTKIPYCQIEEQIQDIITEAIGE